MDPRLALVLKSALIVLVILSVIAGVCSIKSAFDIICVGGSDTSVDEFLRSILFAVPGAAGGCAAIIGSLAVLRGARPLNGGVMSLLCYCVAMFYLSLLLVCLPQLRGRIADVLDGNAPIANMLVAQLLCGIFLQLIRNCSMRFLEPVS